MSNATACLVEFYVRKKMYEEEQSKKDMMKINNKAAEAKGEATQERTSPSRSSAGKGFLNIFHKEVHPSDSSFKSSNK